MSQQPDILFERDGITAIPGLIDLWSETLGDPEIRIAILDGPVDLEHPSFGPKAAKFTILGSSGGLKSKSGIAADHGTHVASVIFGQHNGPIKGIAPQCSGILHTIFHDGPDGNIQSCSQHDLATAINTAVKNGTHVINISGGQPAPGGRAEAELVRAVENCAEKNVLVVAAAGNRGCDGLDACECVHVPGALPAVLAVGAMNRRGEPLEFSNYGQQYRNQGVLAWGENILGAVPGNKTTSLTGTSFATPIVSGVAGLLLSLQRKLGQKVNPQTVRDAILASAEGCEIQQIRDCSQLLMGRLNISKAVSLIKGGSSGMNIEQSTPESLPIESNGQLPPNVPQKACALGEHHSEEPKGAMQASRLSNNGAASLVAVGQIDGATVPERTSRPITPAACSCQHNGQLVYVIGDLDLDFGTHTNLKSMEANVDQGDVQDHNGHGIQHVYLASPRGLLEYLLGYEIKACDSKDIRKTVCGNLYDARFVNWVMKHDDCPKYVVRPQGTYAEEANLELVRFLIEHWGINPFEWVDIPGSHPSQEKRIRTDCLKGFFSCHGGAICSPEKAFTEELREGQGERQRLSQTFSALLQEHPSRAAHIAIAGEVAGTTRLFTGEIVEVISPSMRGTTSWNTLALVQRIPPESQQAFLVRVVSALYEQARNDGKTAEERALNFSATFIARVLGAYLLDPLFANIAVEGGGNNIQNLALDSIDVKPARCKRIDSLPYDVELTFYDSASQFRAKTVLAVTVDVAEVNPVVDDQRFFQRR